MRLYLTTFRRVFPGTRSTLAAVVIALGIFALIYAVAVNQGFFLRSAITELDADVLEMTLVQRGDTRSAAFLFFTYLGNWEIVASISLVVLALMLLARKVRAAWFLAVTLAVSQFLSLFFKYLLSRSRPDTMHALIEQGGYSFPSGHAFGSFIFYGMLAYLAGSLLKKHWQHIALFIASALLIGLVSISRLYLGVHWFSDIIAGWLMGGTLLILFIVFFEHRKALFPVSHRDPIVSRTTLLTAGVVLTVGEAIFIVWYYLNHPIS